MWSAEIPRSFEHFSCQILKMLREEGSALIYNFFSFEKVSSTAGFLEAEKECENTVPS